MMMIIVVTGKDDKSNFTMDMRRVAADDGDDNWNSYEINVTDYLKRDKTGSACAEDMWMFKPPLRWKVWSLFGILPSSF